jgi:hypothetical protein
VSRQQIATAAVRAIAIWMIVQGAAAGAGSVIFLARTRSLGVPDQPSGQLLFTVVVILLVGGMILWASARWIAALIFRDRQSDEAALVPDLYRIASAFAGVVLLSQSLPSVFRLVVDLGVQLHLRSERFRVRGAGRPRSRTPVRCPNESRNCRHDCAACSWCSPVCCTRNYRANHHASAARQAGA